MLNLHDFCDENESREYLQKPMTIGPHTVATDGNIALIAPTLELYEPAPDKIALLVKDILITIAQSIFIPLPVDLVFPKLINCLTCNGLKKAQVNDCPECNGESYVAFANNFSEYEFICKTCDGDGEFIQTGGDKDCPECKGKGTIYLPFATVNVFNILINPDYLNLIINEPDLQVCAYPDAYKLYFKAVDQCGLIMGNRQ